jgi:hypothetical protein
LSGLNASAVQAWDGPRDVGAPLRASSDLRKRAGEFASHGSLSLGGCALLFSHFGGRALAYHLQVRHCPPPQKRWPPVRGPLARFLQIRFAVRGLGNPDREWQPPVGADGLPEMQRVLLRVVAPWRARRPGHYGRERCAMSRGNLKARRPVFSAGFQLPAARSVSGRWSWKP